MTTILYLLYYPFETYILKKDWTYVSHRLSKEISINTVQEEYLDTHNDPLGSSTGPTVVLGEKVEYVEYRIYMGKNTNMEYWVF